MSIEELKKYEEYEEEEIEISKFLEARKGQAFTYMEIYQGLRELVPYTPNKEGSYWTWENAGAFMLNVLAVDAFHNKLKRMVDSGKIKMKVAKGEEYYYIE